MWEKKVTFLFLNFSSRAVHCCHMINTMGPRGSFPYVNLWHTAVEMCSWIEWPYHRLTHLSSSIYQTVLSCYHTICVLITQISDGQCQLHSRDFLLPPFSKTHISQEDHGYPAPSVECCLILNGGFYKLLMFLDSHDTWIVSFIVNVTMKHHHRHQQRKKINSTIKWTE